MGSCHGCDSNGESGSSRLISEELRKEGELKLYGQNWNQIVLLGSSRSGKTSMLNQLNYLYNDGDIDSKHKLHAIKDIRQNCMDNILILCHSMDDEKSIESLEQLSTENDNDLSNISEIISNQWNQAGMKIKYENRHFDVNEDEYLLNENMDYFFDKINEIMNVNYDPTMEDIIKHNSTNPAIRDIEIKTRESSYIFQISDIGTIRNERFCKQIHFFEAASAVIVMVDLSGYCKRNIDEIEYDINDMHESLGLFDKIVNSRYCRYSSIILVLNKKDIFTQCLKAGISLKICFPDYDGAEYENIKIPMIASYISREIEQEIHVFIPNDVIEIIEMYLKVEMPLKYKDMRDEEYFEICYKESLQYIRDIYLCCNNDYGNRQIYSHVTDTMDSEMIGKVFYDITHSIIVNSLQRNS